MELWLHSRAPRKYKKILLIQITSKLKIIRAILRLTFLVSETDSLCSSFDFEMIEYFYLGILKLRLSLSIPFNHKDSTRITGWTVGINQKLR